MSESLPMTLSPAAPDLRTRLRGYYELTKPRLSGLVLVTVAAGYAMAAGGDLRLLLLLHTVVGVGLVSGGGGALNMYLERHLDARMNRTRRRPLPAGDVTPAGALAFGLVAGLSGLAYLALIVNLLTAVLAAIAFVNYVAVYTPLKTRSTVNTLVGAVTGALPPMMGWTAFEGEIGTGGWVVFAILFVWQMPHFLAIAWFCREDYARVGMKMLSVYDSAEGPMTTRQMALFSLVLIPVSLLPTTTGLAGEVYAVAAAALGAGVFALAVAAVLRPTRAKVRWVFLASLAYLPALFTFMIFDRTP